MSYVTKAKTASELRHELVRDLTRMRDDAAAQLADAKSRLGKRGSGVGARDVALLHGMHGVYEHLVNVYTQLWVNDKQYVSASQAASDWSKKVSSK